MMQQEEQTAVLIIFKVINAVLAGCVHQNNGVRFLFKCDSFHITMKLGLKRQHFQQQESEY